jgi:hypothetical protein
VETGKMPNLEEMENEITHSSRARQSYAVIGPGVCHAIRLLCAQGCWHLRSRKPVLLRVNVDAEPAPLPGRLGLLQLMSGDRDEQSYSSTAAAENVHAVDCRSEMGLIFCQAHFYGYSRGTELAGAQGCKKTTAEPESAGTDDLSPQKMTCCRRPCETATLPILSDPERAGPIARDRMRMKKAPTWGIGALEAQ